MASEQLRLCLVGATGLVGSAVIAYGATVGDVYVVGVGRPKKRSAAKPRNAEILLGEPIDWPELIRKARADVLVCALGTTMKAAGSRARFRAIDHDLVRYAAEGAIAAGIDHMIVVSSVGADAGSRNFYLKVKGETEEALARLPFSRLDVVRPSLLRGPRPQWRPLERAGQVAAPILGPLFLHGYLRRYRPVRASDVAKAIVNLARQTARGQFVHEFDGIMNASRSA